MARYFQSLSNFLETSTAITKDFKTVPKENIIIPDWKMKARISSIAIEGFKEDLKGPLVVMPSSSDGIYILIDGYRRYKSSNASEFECYIIKYDDSDEGMRIAPVLSLLLNRKEPYTNQEVESILEDSTISASRIADNVYDNVLGLDSGAISSTREVLALKDDAPAPLIKLKDSFSKEKVTPSQLIGKLKSAKKKVEKQEEDIESDGTLGNKDMTNSLRKDKLKQNPNNRERIDPALKKAVLIRDNNTCQCCGLHGPQWASSLVFHHKVPVALGGLDTMDNGITLCVNCHLAVHTYQVGELFIPDNLTGKEKETLDKICELGNIAIKAARDLDLETKDVKKLTSDEARHPYPTENLRINREAIELSETIANKDEMQGDELLKVVKEAE